MKNNTYCFVNNLKINNIEKNKNIIDFLENLKIQIPHFCYHPNLSVAGNCRMCLIELKNSPKPLVSCAMLLTNKMEIFTHSPLVKKARENIMEFLLLNHPLDCPICDQGGECDLQDQSMVFGTDKKRFYKYKRSVSNKNIGVIVKTVMTRCIHCTKCVRFADEIAGIDDLGTFGRGVNTEIGTYVNKIFKSELSGNVIDICPVGALTAKPYSFFDRVWELKNFEFIDFVDGFNLNLEISIKNDSNVTKISSNFNSDNVSNTWISDKTRFSFDGMFSPERVSNIIIFEKQKQKVTWENLFKEFIHIIYFKDHLSKHLLKTFKITILINNNLNIETLNSLIFLQKKYNFFSIKKLDNSNINSDLKTHYSINTANQLINLNKSTLCFLLNINTRLEGSNLNIKLRQRYLKGNFKIFSLNSLIDLTYPSKFLGSNIRILKNLIEGNHFLGQEFKNSLNPIFIYNSELLNRKDSLNIEELIINLKNFTKIYNKTWNGFNILNSEINKTGLNNFSVFKPFKMSNLINSSGLYFLGSNLNSNILKIFLELKLLNYSKREKNQEKFLISQNNFFDTNNLNFLKKKLNICSSFFLPNTIFYETSGIYLNTENYYKKTIKIIPSINQAKTDWQITRRLYYYLSNVKFLNNNINNKISFDFFKNNMIIKYINFNYFPIINFKLFAMFLTFKQNNYFSFLNKFKNKHKKILKTKSILWLDDFYLGGKDLYSKKSKVMVECSKLVRKKTTNFFYLI